MNKKTSITVLIGLVIVCIFALWKNARNEHVSIGVVLPLTGTLASVGEDMKNGATMAANETGTSIVFSDGQANPQKSLDGAKQIILQHNTPVVLTAFRGATMSISSNLAHDPVIVASVTGTTKDKIVSTSTENLFVIGPEVVASGEVLGSYARKNSLCTKSGTLIEQTDVAKDKARGFDQGLNTGLEEVHEVFDPVATDWRSSILKFRSASVDCLFVEVRSNSLPTLLKQFEENNFHPLIFANSYSFTPAAIQTSPVNQISKLIYSANYMELANSSGFFKKYKETYGRDATDFATMAYEFVHMLSGPIQDCSGNVSCIRERVSVLSDVESSLGKLTVNQNREIQLTKYNLFSVVDGKPAEIRQ
jgi:branched-chain amino acid transport system substrate-binding protein